MRFSDRFLRALFLASLTALFGACTPAADLPLDIVDAGADLVPLLPACEATSPRHSPTRLAVFPDESEIPYVQVAAGAQKSLRVMVYLMGRGGILDTLKAKAQKGVSVRVILDGGQSSNVKYRDELIAAGVEVIWSDPKWSYMHAKVLIADEREALVSTGNYSLYSIDRERNFGARITDSQDIEQLISLFEADWQRRAPDLSCTRLVVSPENARQRLLAFIDSAQKSLLVESMQFADGDIRGHVAARAAAGVEVRVLLADPGWITANSDGAAYLKARGIPVRWRPGLHVKAMVADGARAYVGSENFSWTSLTKNREVGVILTEPDPVSGVSSTFEKDWATATPF